MERGTSQMDFKTKIYEDLDKRYNELNKKLMTMMQAGPEFDATIAEMRRIDKRLQTLSSPESYNKMRLDEEEERKQKQKYKQDKMQKMKEMEKINQEILTISMEMMKHSFKPLLITFIPLLIIFWWAKKAFVLTSLASSWIWWYIGASLIASTIFRKILKVH